MSERIVRVDVDGVVADLQTPWLRRINDQHGCFVQVEDLTEWNITKFLPERAVADCYSHLHDPMLYSEVLPYPEALQGVENLRDDGWRVVFVSSCTPAGMGAKAEWLVEHGFLPAAYIPADFIAAHDKSLVAPWAPLVDDGLHNLKGLDNGILFDRPWNRASDHPHRATNWRQVRFHLNIFLWSDDYERTVKLRRRHNDPPVGHV